MTIKSAIICTLLGAGFVYAHATYEPEPTIKQQGERHIVRTSGALLAADNNCPWSLSAAGRGYVARAYGLENALWWADEFAAGADEEYESMGRLNPEDYCRFKAGVFHDLVS